MHWNTYLPQLQWISADSIYVFSQEIKVNLDDTPPLNNAENKKEIGDTYAEKLLESDTKM